MAVGTKGPRQFQGVFDCIPFKATVDFASVADGNEAVSALTVGGAELGDFVLVAAGIDVQDLALVAQVTAADEVTVQVGNWTGGTINLGSQTITGIVLKPKDNVFADL